MAQKTRDELKGFFQSGKIPTEGNFADLIDSAISQTEDALVTENDIGLGIRSKSEDELILGFYKYGEDDPAWITSLFDSDKQAGGLFFSSTASSCASALGFWDNGNITIGSAGEPATETVEIIGGIETSYQANFYGGFVSKDRSQFDADIDLYAGLNIRDIATIAIQADGEALQLIGTGGIQLGSLDEQGNPYSLLNLPNDGAIEANAMVHMPYSAKVSGELWLEDAVLSLTGAVKVALNDSDIKPIEDVDGMGRAGIWLLGENAVDIGSYTSEAGRPPILQIEDTGFGPKVRVNGDIHACSNLQFIGRDQFSFGFPADGGARPPAINVKDSPPGHNDVTLTGNVVVYGTLSAPYAIRQIQSVRNADVANEYGYPYGVSPLPTPLEINIDTGQAYLEISANLSRVEADQLHHNVEISIWVNDDKIAWQNAATSDGWNFKSIAFTTMVSVETGPQNIQVKFASQGDVKVYFGGNDNGLRYQELFVKEYYRA